MAKPLNVFRLHSVDELQLWMTRNEDLREELEKLMGIELGVDAASLDTLEGFLIKRYAGAEVALRLDERAVVDAASRHLGLVMVLSVDGAKWAINLEDDQRAFYSLPIIRFPNGDEACPLALVTASLSRREGNFLQTVVKNYEEMYGSAD